MEALTLWATEAEEGRVSALVQAMEGQAGHVWWCQQCAVVTASPHRRGTGGQVTPVCRIRNDLEGIQHSAVILARPHPAAAPPPPPPRA